MDLGPLVDSVELDLLDTRGIIGLGLFFGNLGGTCFDAEVGVVDVVEEDGGGLVAFGGYPGL